MSRIVTSLNCEACNYKLDTYISFGHPDENFSWRWKCEKCGFINTYFVKAMPMRRVNKIRNYIDYDTEE